MNHSNEIKDNNRHYISVRVPLSVTEEQSFDRFVESKGLKKGAFIASLINAAVRGERRNG